MSRTSDSMKGSYHNSMSVQKLRLNLSQVSELQDELNDTFQDDIETIESKQISQSVSYRTPKQQQDLQFQKQTQRKSEHCKLFKRRESEEQSNRSSDESSSQSQQEEKYQQNSQEEEKYKAQNLYNPILQELGDLQQNLNRFSKKFQEVKETSQIKFVIQINFQPQMKHLDINIKIGEEFTLSKKLKPLYSEIEELFRKKLLGQQVYMIEDKSYQPSPLEEGPKFRISNIGQDNIRVRSTTTQQQQNLFGFKYGNILKVPSQTTIDKSPRRSSSKLPAFASPSLTPKSRSGSESVKNSNQNEFSSLKYLVEMAQQGGQRTGSFSMAVQNLNQKTIESEFLRRASKRVRQFQVMNSQLVQNDSSSSSDSDSDVSNSSNEQNSKNYIKQTQQSSFNNDSTNAITPSPDKYDIKSVIQEEKSEDVSRVNSRHTSIFKKIHTFEVPHIDLTFTENQEAQIDPNFTPNLPRIVPFFSQNSSVSKAKMLLVIGKQTEQIFRRLTKSQTWKYIKEECENQEQVIRFKFIGTGVIGLLGIILAALLLSYIKVVIK